MFAQYTYMSMRMSLYNPKRKDTVYIYDTPNGEVARFRAAGYAYDSENKSHFWKTFNFIAYGNVAQQIKRMKLSVGSYVNIQCEPIFRDLEALEINDPDELRLRNTLWHNVNSISYVLGTTSPEKRKKRKEEEPEKDAFLEN